jgi:type VI secretion system protein ImpH
MRLLPGAKSEAALVALVRNYLGDEFAWDLQLILKKDEVPATVLGSSGQLGWTSWLGKREEATDAGDVIIDLQRSIMSRKPH